ncbi:12672_t:CDS:2, partial [Entrophospora sp. SA101]
MDIKYLKTLVLNILKNTSPGDIANGIDVPELDSCSLCNDELFLRLIKKPFTALPCGHIFHRTCLENSIINGVEICPAHVIINAREDTSNTSNFLYLYSRIDQAESKNETTNQDVIRCYYCFGKALEDRFEHYKKTNPKRTAQALVNEEVRKQLPQTLIGEWTGDRNLEVKNFIEILQKALQQIPTHDSERISILRSFGTGNPLRQRVSSAFDDISSLLTLNALNVDAVPWVNNAIKNLDTLKRETRKLANNTSGLEKNMWEYIVNELSKLRVSDLGYDHPLCSGILDVCSEPLVKMPVEY